MVGNLFEGKDTITFELTNEKTYSMFYMVLEQKVMLDFDFARIYGYETRALNRQIQRNIDIFPCRYLFQLTKDEIDSVISQIVTSRKTANYFTDQSGAARKLPTPSPSEEMRNFVKCQNGTSPNSFFSGQEGGSRKLPYAFTEQGIYMIMTVL